jgi:hypothetical protein
MGALFVTFPVKGQKSSALMTPTEKGRPRYVNGKDHSMDFFLGRGLQKYDSLLWKLIRSLGMLSKHNNKSIRLAIFKTYN